MWLVAGAVYSIEKPRPESGLFCYYLKKLARLQINHKPQAAPRSPALLEFTSYREPRLPGTTGCHLSEMPTSRPSDEKGVSPVPNLYGLSFSGERSASYSRRSVTELFLK
jgi:hypothetical protein